MTLGQQKKLGAAMGNFGGAGGTLDVDGVPRGTGDLAGMVGALSCLDTNQIESLMSDMATLQMMAEANALGNQYQPDGANGSKPRLHVRCGSGDWGATWS